MDVFAQKRLTATSCLVAWELLQVAVNREEFVKWRLWCLSIARSEILTAVLHDTEAVWCMTACWSDSSQVGLSLKTVLHPSWIIIDVGDCRSVDVSSYLRISDVSSTGTVYLTAKLYGAILQETWFIIVINISRNKLFLLLCHQLALCILLPSYTESYSRKLGSLSSLTYRGTNYFSYCVINWHCVSYCQAIWSHTCTPGSSVHYHH
jgi:hypothetical protein